MRCRIVAFVGICLSLIFASCQTTKNQNEVTLKLKDISFETDAGGTLTVNNEASADIVLFAGKVEKNALLGGVRANSTRNFDLTKIPDIPAFGSLLIRACTYEVFSSKARITEEDVVYTGLVVYNLNDSQDRYQLTIYKNIDVTQSHCIYVSNLSSSYVLELRKDSPSQGEVLATLAPRQRHKCVYLEPAQSGYGIDIYPTFIYVDPRTGEKTAIVGDSADGETVLPDAVNSKRINTYEFSGPNSNSIGYKVAFVNLHNDTKKTLELRSAGEDLLNDKGFRATLSGRTDVYELDSLNGAVGQIYTGLNVNIAPASGVLNIAKVTLKPGYVYDLTVTSIDGTYEYDWREVGKRSLTNDNRIQLYNE